MVRAARAGALSSQNAITRAELASIPAGARAADEQRQSPAWHSSRFPPALRDMAENGSRRTSRLSRAVLAPDERQTRGPAGPVSIPRKTSWRRSARWARRLLETSPQYSVRIGIIVPDLGSRYDFGAAPVHGGTGPGAPTPAPRGFSTSAAAPRWLLSRSGRRRKDWLATVCGHVECR